MIEDTSSGKLKIDEQHRIMHWSMNPNSDAARTFRWAVSISRETRAVKFFGWARKEKGRDGFSLIELVVVISALGIVLSMGVASFNGWSERQRGSNSAGELAQMLFVGRSEAIRKGANHIVFFGTDTSGTQLVGEDGSTPLAALLIEDSNGNFSPDAGEQRMSVSMRASENIEWGRVRAPILVPHEGGRVAGDPFSGTGVENSAQELGSAGNFRHPTQLDSVQSWVLFAPDGTPRAFDPSASSPVAAMGTGNGAVYLNDGERDHAVVVTALGAVRSYRWDVSDSSWK